MLLFCVVLVAAAVVGDVAQMEARIVELFWQHRRKYIMPLDFARLRAPWQCFAIRFYFFLLLLGECFVFVFLLFIRSNNSL